MSEAKGILDVRECYEWRSEMVGEDEEFEEYHVYCRLCGAVLPVGASSPMELRGRFLEPVTRHLWEECLWSERVARSGGKS